MKPPEWVVERAIAAARRSPCAKSRRGAILWDPRFPKAPAIAEGFNGPPMGDCTRDDVCREVCGRVCAHAEARALYGSKGPASPTAPRYLDLLHVKVDDAGDLVAGGPPSCLPCARTILDVGCVDGMWLYESAGGPVWNRYSAAVFYVLSRLNTRTS